MFEKFKMGFSPFNKKDPEIQPLFLWDLDTHPLAAEYKSKYSLQQRQKIAEDWLAYMVANDRWVSLYEWYYGNLQPVHPTNTPAQFSEKIHRMISMPNKRSREVMIGMMSEESESKKHQWQTPTGQTVETNSDLPPWEDLVIDKDNQKFNLRALQADSNQLNDRNIVAGINWANISINKGHKILDNKISVIGKEQREMVKKYLSNMDTNTVLLSQKLDRQFGLLLTEMQQMNKSLVSNITDVRFDVSKIDSNMDAIRNALAELKIDLDATSSKVLFLESKKNLSSIQKSDRAKKIQQEKLSITLPPVQSSFLKDDRRPMQFGSLTNVPIQEAFPSSVQHNWLDPFGKLPSASMTRASSSSSTAELVTHPPEEDDLFNVHNLTEDLHANLPDDPQST